MMASEELVVQIKGLSKSYGGMVALARINLDVKKGEIFGVLGRKGAGKTTLIEIIEGLRKPDKGEINILGLDPARNLKSIKERIGVQLQRPSFYGNLKVIEVLKQFRSYYGRKADLEKLLADVALSEKRSSYVNHLSGEQLRRLALALSLINDPEIVFLDEPTRGLELTVRRQVGHIIGRIKEEGKTVFMTTHYTEEAESLCDRVCIIEAGQIVALDSPSNIISGVRGRNARINLTTMKPLDFDHIRGIRLLESSLNGDASYVLEAENTGPTLIALVNDIERQNNELISLNIVRASIEDAFVELTGKSIK